MRKSSKRLLVNNKYEEKGRFISPFFILECNLLCLVIELILLYGKKLPEFFFIDIIGPAFSIIYSRSKDFYIVRF